MNRVKRLGDATAFELALAKTPVMVTIVCCIFGTAAIYFSQPFAILMVAITLFPIIFALQRIFSDNFNGRNMLFCRQFSFTAGETLCAKLTVTMLMFTFYGVLFVGALLLFDMLPENFSPNSAMSILFAVSPSNLMGGITGYIATTLSGGLFFATIFLSLGAFEDRNKRTKDSKAKIFLKKLSTPVIVFAFSFFRAEIVEFLRGKAMGLGTIITVIVTLCFAAVLIYISYRKMRSYMTD